MLGQYREADTPFRQEPKCLKVHRGLGKPHALRFSSESVLEITDAPCDLRLLVSTVRQR